MKTMKTTDAHDDETPGLPFAEGEVNVINITLPKKAATGGGQKKPPILVLKHFAPFSARAIEVMKAGNAASICGHEGSGVTTLCSYILSQWKRASLGRVLSFQATHETDPLKMMQFFANLVLGDDMPENWRLHNFSYLYSAVATKLRELDIRLIHMDRADRAPERFIECLLALADATRNTQNPVGVLLGMRAPKGHELQLFDCDNQTNVGFTGKLKPLTVSEIVPILKKVSSKFDSLCDEIANNNQAAIETGLTLERLAGGNFRRIIQFADYIDEGGKSFEASAVNAESIWRRAFLKTSA